MKVTLNRDALLGQLSTVVRVVSSRSAVQALSGVLVRAAEDRVELRATDMEVGLRVGLPAAIERAGEAVVPARLLLDVVRSLAGSDVGIEVRAAEHDVELRGAAATFHLRTLRAEDFPPFPEPLAEGRLTIPTRAFVQTVETVARAASRDDTRPVLTGVLVSASGRQLEMVATDSYRLSVKRTELEADLDGAFEANVPARALQELARIAGQGEAQELTVGVGANQILFETAGTILSSRLIDGQFPNHRQLLPDSCEHELRLGGEEVTEVVRRVSLMAQKNAPLRLAFREGELTISAQTPDVGEASESLPVPFHGEPLEIGFNPEFLRDGLESVAPADIVLKLISPLRPGLIEAADDPGFHYLVMPIRLNV